MAFDVFISYATEDRVVANAVCARLEAAGIRCWIAPRDITAGTSYGEAIIEAIHEVKVMVLVFSSSANASGHIPKEVERAVSNSLTIIPFRIEDVVPAKSLDYFIGSVHWLDAMSPPMDRHLDNLAETVRKLLPPRDGAAPAPPWPPQPPVQPPVVRPVPAGGAGSGVSSKTLGVGAAAVVVLAAIVWAAIHFGHNPNPTPAPEPVPSPVPGPVAGPSPTPGPEVITGDPIVGCYHWFNNGIVAIDSDGTVIGGPFTGHWRDVNMQKRSYRITWPPAIATVTIAANQQSLSGQNQYAYPISGVRTSGASGLAGSWNIGNNVSLLVFPNGTFVAAQFKGTWKAVNAAQGTYALTWPSPVDSLTLSADYQTLSGANQYGVAISGTRTQPCTAR